MLWAFSISRSNWPKKSSPSTPLRSRVLALLDSEVKHHDLQPSDLMSSDFDQVSLGDRRRSAYSRTPHRGLAALPTSEAR